MASRRLMLFSFNMGHLYPLSEIADMLTQSNSERARFLVSDFYGNHLDGHYYTIVTRNETVYDFETGQVEKMAIDRTVIIQYSIDIEKKLMLVCGASAIISQFVTAMAICLNNTVTIDAQNVDLKKFVYDVSDDQRFMIRKARILDVAIGGGILANCTIDVFQNSDASVFLKKHSENIAQIGVSVLIFDSENEDEEMISLSIYHTGSIVFHSSVDIFADEWRNVVYRIWGR